jgi:hypothetical protein
MGVARIPSVEGGIQPTIFDAKADLLTATANDTPARLAVGANETRLVADSAVSTGLKYVADTTNYAIAAKGDLLAGTAADTVAALTVGANDTVLTADSSTATGLKWATPAASGFVGVRAYKDANQSIADSTATAVTYAAENFDTNSFHDNVTNNSRFTVPSGQGGYYLCIAQNAYANVAATGSREVVFRKNGSTYMTQTSIPGANIARANCVYAVEVLNLVATDYVEVLAYQTSGGSLNLVHDLSTVSYFTMIKVG